MKSKEGDLANGIIRHE